MRNTAKKFGADVLLEPEAIRDWFDEVYWRAGEKLLDKAGILGKFLFSRRSGTLDFAYRSVAEAYRMVEDTMVPVIIEREELRIVSVRGRGGLSSPRWRCNPGWPSRTSVYGGVWRLQPRTEETPMTETNMALIELLQKQDDGDFLRAVAEAVLQLLMEHDVEGVIGAGRYERGERPPDLAQRLS